MISVHAKWDLMPSDLARCTSGRCTDHATVTCVAIVGIFVDLAMSID